MPTGTYIDPENGQKIQFSVPNGKTKDEAYITQAINLARENKKPILQSETPSGSGTERFLGGAKDAILGMAKSLPMMGPGDAISQMQHGYRMMSNDPNERMGAMNETRDMVRNSPGIADINRISSGDIAGEIGSLTPQIIGSIMGISPKARAGVAGGFKGVGNELANVPGPATMLYKGGLPAIGGSLVGASMGHPIYGAEVGGAIGLLGKAAYEGVKGAGKAFAEEPRWYNNQLPRPTYDAELMDPGIHPFQYSGNPVSRRLPPPDPANRVFNMSGGFSGGEVPNNIMADYPPKALPPASQFQMGAVPHTLDINPQIMRALPAPGGEVPRTQGAIPMSGNVANEGNLTRGTTSSPSVSPAEPIKSPPNNSPYTPLENSGENHFISMSAAARYAESLGMQFGDAIQFLRNEGIKVVSDWDLGGKVAKQSGLNAKGRKLK